MLIRSYTLVLLSLALFVALAPSQALAGDPSAASLADLGVQVAPNPKAWTPDDLDSLRQGALALPSAIRERVGTIRFQRVRRPCPFGMGVYNTTCPTFSDAGKATFIIYDAPPIQGDGPPTRLAALDKTERRDILVRRAVVHAFMSVLDRKLGWSKAPGWRRLNAWRDGTHASNKDPWGYSRHLGMRSAHLDLVTFAEEYFVRPEDILRDSPAEDASARLAKLDPDLAMQCQEFSKMRRLAAAIAELDPTWSPREDVDAWPSRCNAFDQWARLDTLEGIDVVFAAATADRPQSLWGHLLLHIRHKDVPEGLEPVYQFGAVTDTDVHPLDYLTRGLMGGFYSVFDPNTFRTTDRLILQKEQRSLRRYRLRLSRAQSLRVLQRVWEVERRQRLPYWFFDENCAALLLDLLHSALPEVDIPARSDFIVAPTDVLDHLAAVDNGTRGPLLFKLPDDLFSNREYARWAKRRRAQLLDRLLSGVERAGVERAGVEATAPKLYDGISSAAAAMESADPDVRRRSYTRAATLLEQLVRAASGAPETIDRLEADAIAYLYYCVRIERYFVEDHLYRTHDVLARARSNPIEHSARERLEDRRELYRHEDLERRRRQLLEREQAFLRELSGAEHEPLDDDERRALERDRQTRLAYAAAVTAQHRLVTRLEPGFDAVAFWDDERKSFQRRQASHDARSLGSSGKGRLAIGGASTLEGGKFSGALELAYSFLYERLGSQRRRGFRADIETRVFGLHLLATPGDAMLDEIDLDVVLLRYLSLERRMEPVQRDLFDAFGYGFDIRAGHDGRRGVDVEFQSAAGLLYPLWASEHFADHVLVGAFPSVRWTSAAQTEVTLTGLWLMANWQVHLYGAFANVLRLEAGVTPFYAITTHPGLQDQSLHFDAVAEVSTNHVVGSLERRPLIIAPYLLVESTDLVFDAGPHDLTSWRGGLRVELPF